MTRAAEKSAVRRINRLAGKRPFGSASSAHGRFVFVRRKANHDPDNF